VIYTASTTKMSVHSFF